MTALTLPALSGFTTFYGVPVSPIGEEADLVILGHHNERTVIAALNRFVKQVLDFRDLADYAGLHRLDGRLRSTWAVQLVDGCGDHEPSDDSEDPCWKCAQIRESVENGSWFLRYGVSESEPGAFPIMVWTN